MKTYLKLVTKQKALSQTFELLANVGVKFEHEKALSLFRERGATVEGNTVYLPEKMMRDALEITPRQAHAEARTKRVAGANPFCNAPFIVDDATGKIRRCHVADEIKMFQIAETSPVYECANPGFADPEGIDCEDAFIAQIAMTLKYSAKYPSIGLRATGSNTKNGDVYNSAKKALRLIRRFYDVWDEPVMTQGICPNPPMSYDKECLDNLFAALDEKQDISLFPCGISFMTVPETILDLVVHDFAMALAGVCLIELYSPGHTVSLSEFSAVSDIRTMQPAYGNAESVIIQVLFYELAGELHLPCTICGCYGDGIAADYQSGMEAMLTMLLPFQLTEIDEVWCYPGHLSGFSCGSFRKAILDEEAIRCANRALRPTEHTVNTELPSLIAAGIREGSFLTIGSMANVRREQYLPDLFPKNGVAKAMEDDTADLIHRVDRAIAQRVADYQAPSLTKTQENLLNPYLPSACL